MEQQQSQPQQVNLSTTPLNDLIRIAYQQRKSIENQKANLELIERYIDIRLDLEPKNND